LTSIASHSSPPPAAALGAAAVIAVVGLCFASAIDAQDVVIHEVLAINEDGLRDADGDASDWIELRNRGATPARLDGWHLTDDATFPEKWRFPDVVVEPGGFLVVFASSTLFGAFLERIRKRIIMAC